MLIGPKPTKVQDNLPKTLHDHRVHDFVAGLLLDERIYDEYQRILPPC